MLKASELVGRVKDLASLPDVYVQVQQLINDPNASISDIGKIISSDPAITARLLKIANSPFFGMAAKIETISRAISIMGTQQLHDLLLATSVTGAFKNRGKPEFDMTRFWTNSIRVAVCARLLAYECNVLDSERLFVAGLLHDIGHLAMHQVMPEISAEAASCVEARQESPAQIERELYFGFDYAEVGGLLLSQWNLPPMILETVAFHNSPESADQYPFETSIIHCSVEICNAIKIHRNPLSALESIAPTALQQTGIDEEMIKHIEAQSREHMAETIALLLPDQRAA